MESSLQKKILTNTIWTFVGKFSYLIISLIANIVLARILGPEVFGKIAIILFFITIATVLTESGLSGALIKADKVEDSDYSTVFLFNIFISFIIVLIMYFSSSLIAEFYHDESLHSLIIASSLVLLINAFRMVQSTKLIRNL
jgi:O-antigen/teichoic acid export membrane protein